jgi:hypothetical protein
MFGPDFAAVLLDDRCFRPHLISEREIAPMRAEAPAKMSCKLIDCRLPSDGPAKSPVKI